MPQSLTAFRTFVAQDAATQALLKDISDPHRFTEETVRLGRERGYEFAPADVQEALRHERRTWLERWLAPPEVPAPFINDLAPLRQCVPSRIIWRPGATDASVEWVSPTSEDENEPFFEATLQRAMQRPFNLLCRPVTRIDQL